MNYKIFIFIVNNYYKKIKEPNLHRMTERKIIEINHGLSGIYGK